MKLFNTHPRSFSVLDAPDYVDAVVLVSGVASTFAVPPKTSILIFSANCDYFVAYSGAATVPGASTATGLANELNPAARAVSLGTTSISIISPQGGTLTIACYQG